MQLRRWGFNMSNAVIIRALQREIKQLDDNIRASLEYADKEKDFMIGSTYRFIMKQQKESYQRLLKDITNGQ